ncbi:succinate dehydrogenase, hydrophobic membrane anchor protein [Novosphingobium sp. G106]|uniref:succinate dehydrogenase, hydrophobic membrane anchor protein n=1 Tax=Novosphingobium sp. G106 TaxID=2849500 RepID=UPI001C2D1437|nr:succinate dehydrogenase, hydrophobic membrane anchor protein [Novosphingobium sp. G106]MBV1686910.1 succinate dehydrogenase, hydrophobic membrane anchor protein [Novosphingobium sp. G106]
MGNGTSIGRVRGLGSAKSGSHHWLVQRFTAIGNLVLVLWFVVSLLMMHHFDYQTVREWLVRPLPATAMALLIISTFWHARLGMQVAMEDYVHDDGNKFALIALLNLLAFGGAAFGLFCVIRLALGGA